MGVIEYLQSPIYLTIRQLQHRVSEMATASSGDEDNAPDPQTQRAMLEKVQDITDAEGWMPPTPVWQAPILATAIAGLAMMNNGPSGWALAGAIVGPIAFVVAFVDQMRRQRVVPRRPRKPVRPILFYGFILAVALVVTLAWRTLSVPDHSARSALILAGAWSVTAVVFAIGITVSNQMRDRWTRQPS